MGTISYSLGFLKNNNTTEEAIQYIENDLSTPYCIEYEMPKITLEIYTSR